MRVGNGAAAQEIACLYGILHYMKVKKNYHNKHGSRGSSVSTETSWTTGVEFMTEERNSSVLHCVHTESRANPASDPTGTWTSFPGEMNLGRETDHSPPPSDECKNGGATPPLSHKSSQCCAELLN